MEYPTIILLYNSVQDHSDKIDRLNMKLYKTTILVVILLSIALINIYSYPFRTLFRFNPIRTMATTFSEYRKSCYQNQISKNTQQVIQDAQSRNKTLIKKIESFRLEKLTDTERESITVDMVCERIIANDPFICAFFRKDPTKQSLDEVCQIQWLKDHLSPAVYKLPADGIGAKFFINGAIGEITSMSPRPNNATKTLDTFDPVSNTYGVLKHTSVAGGSQDNQLRDVKDFVREMVKYLDATPDAAEVFALYLDGPYYTDERLGGIRQLIPEAWNTVQREKIQITNCQAIVKEEEEEQEEEGDDEV